MEISGLLDLIVNTKIGAVVKTSLAFKMIDRSCVFFTFLGDGVGLLDAVLEWKGL